MIKNRYISTLLDLSLSEILKGIDERVIPEIRLTKSKDTLMGKAFFIFQKPFVFLEEDFNEAMELLDAAFFSMDQCLDTFANTSLRDSAKEICEKTIALGCAGLFS